MKESLLLPIKSLKIKYVPLLAVYFAVGLNGMAAVATTMFLKEHMSLEPADLISIGIWAGLPWSIKMVFGSLIDGVTIFGNNRKSYVYLGGLLMATGLLAKVDHASTQYIMGVSGEYLGLVLSGLLLTTGIVIADIVADTMAIELVDEGPGKDQELGMIQVLSRMAISLGAVIGGAMAGPLAANLPYDQVFLLTLVCPAIMVIATIVCRTGEAPKARELDTRILLGGIGYGAMCVATGSMLGDHSQEVLFVIAMAVLGWMMSRLMKELETSTRKNFIIAMIAIFMFRVIPGVGPAGQWFYIEELGFDENFLGLLGTIAAITSFLALWGLSRSVTNSSIFKTMAWLTGLVTVLSLPDILVYYGFHELIGVSAKSLVLIDTALIAPMAQLSMIPLGVIIAKNAPASSRAVYISLTASLMNISLVGGDILTKLLNKIFVVTRNDFSQLGELMIWSLAISTVLSIIGLVLLRRNK